MLQRIENFLRQLGNGGSRLFQQDGWFIFVLIILNLPMFIQELFYGARIVPFDEGLPAGFKLFYSGAFFTVLSSALINFLLKNSPRVKLFLQKLIVVVALIFFVTDIFLLYKFQLPLNQNFMQIILGTNPATAKNFLLEYVVNFKVIAGIVLAVVLVLAAIKYLRGFFSTMQEKIYVESLIIQQ